MEITWTAYGTGNDRRYISDTGWRVSKSATEGWDIDGPQGGATRRATKLADAKRIAEKNPGPVRLADGSIFTGTLQLD